MTWLLGKLLASYLLGSVVGSLLLGRLRGVDIRAAGSGNAGATNALRTQGKLFALGTAVIDFGKGMLAVALIAPLAMETSPLGAIETQLACGLAAVVGHCYPLFHGFRGGKGAGTLIGVVLWMFPAVVAVMLAVWLLVLISSGYVGLSTVIAGISFPIALCWLQAPVSSSLAGMAVATALFLIFTHRSNLARLHAGNENRFEQARLLARVFGRRSS